MTFTESSTIEAFIRDQLCGGVTHHTAVRPGLSRRNRQVSGLGWHYLSASNLTRQPHEVLVEDHLRDAPTRRNPSMAKQPDGVDDVISHLRAIVPTACDNDLVQAGEKLTDSILDLANGGVFA